MKFVNLTPHTITLNDGREFQPSGTIARVSNKFTEFNEQGICCVSYGDVENLPQPEQDTIYIKSTDVLGKPTIKYLDYKIRDNAPKIDFKFLKD